jgi:hypothetical protein
MCAEVADRIDSARQKIPEYLSNVKGPTPRTEVDCIDLGTPADVQTRSGCSTCRDISWYFNPTKSMKDAGDDGALSHLMLRLGFARYSNMSSEESVLDIHLVRRIPPLQLLVMV